MPIFSLSRLLAFTFISCFMAASQAQSLDALWQLRITDLKHTVKVDATIRFTKAAETGSCMVGNWKRIVVVSKVAYDNKFFPLDEPLAYKLESGTLTLGRINVCDGYLFLNGKLKDKNVEGSYYASGMLSSEQLGHFSLKQIP